MKNLLTLFAVLFLITANTPTKLQAQDCDDCQYRQKTAACFSIKLGGNTTGDGAIEVSFEAGGQVKCKSGSGSCTPQLCG
ncbi:hypothetical protein MATR_02490 [Marivirga tractuosa]|uniref:Uncharacterized protein n=1 Tax=Marivirga tractuosa (strain ATCC 23168 / DSM 4126 / NBRC 15989 / NCIMB 1408 / VKM B-1430 / H-43) TaxID=643867 RepID=E4TV21_MARTH|nr:hypothetical protein [Marivirga tractuosa]ADR22114.1 hypothetical protein Ftrac_2132 [Marivirga tractuosa DSM 4126]BDD13424.1 hypothetical protein MATR_02490 [Marivirga tractuosa]